MVVYGSSRLGIAVKGRGDGERTWSLAQESNLETNFADVAMLLGPAAMQLVNSIYLYVIREQKASLFTTTSTEGVKNKQ